MTTRADIVAAAREWKDAKTPYMHQASLRGVGCDCIGLIAGVGRECGIRECFLWTVDPDSRGYGRAPDVRMLRKAVDRYLDLIPREEAGPGDILLMKFVDEPQHFAFISDSHPARIIHAYSKARRVVEHRLNAMWNARVVSAHRYRGLA